MNPVTDESENRSPGESGLCRHQEHLDLDLVRWSVPLILLAYEYSYSRTTLISLAPKKNKAGTTNFL